MLVDVGEQRLANNSIITQSIALDLHYNRVENLTLRQIHVTNVDYRFEQSIT